VCLSEQKGVGVERAVRAAIFEVCSDDAAHVCVVCAGWLYIVAYIKVLNNISNISYLNSPPPPPPLDF
jgi:hypothetical protein